MQPAYKVAEIQGMSAQSVRSPGPYSCVCIGIGICESCVYGFSGYRGGPEPFHISGLHCIKLAMRFFLLYQLKDLFFVATKLVKVFIPRCLITEELIFCVPLKKVV